VLNKDGTVRCEVRVRIPLVPEAGLAVMTGTGGFCWLSLDLVDYPTLPNPHGMADNRASSGDPHHLGCSLHGERDTLKLSTARESVAVALLQLLNRAR
jgi:hypothetical protein